LSNVYWDAAHFFYDACRCLTLCAVIKYLLTSQKKNVVVFHDFKDLSKNYFFAPCSHDDQSHFTAQRADVQPCMYLSPKASNLQFIY